MKKQAVNPYLPQNVYIPDSEPHVFGDRLYVFGSHDEEGGNCYCPLDYAGWSAPLDDLSDWRYEGVTYSPKQDPAYSDRLSCLYAPDVVRGNDGRYYMYYALAGGAFTGSLHVAVCDTPAGHYEYYGEVHNPDGSTFDRNITFDPGVINDDGVIRLYYGWSLPGMAAGSPKWLMRIIEKKMFDKTDEQIKREPLGIQGANTIVLADDMLTVIDGPHRIVPPPTMTKGTSFEGHAFFEASSIRKINGKYVFVYSNEISHQLSYAVSDYPDKGFEYRGTLISNGDVGYEGRSVKDTLGPLGNNHGSLVEIKGQWYIFYHRHTHGTCYSRQGCAEKVTMEPDLTIRQVEMTSCGLNDGPLKAKGVYNAGLACNLTNGRMKMMGLGGSVSASLPCITHEGTAPDSAQYIKNITKGTLIGFKYFAFDGETKLALTMRGLGVGVMEVSDGDAVVARVEIAPSSEWTRYECAFSVKGTKPLYLTYKGNKKADLKEIEFC